MAFGAILEKIRFQKRQLAVSSQQAYFNLVRDIASGAEVDPEEAALVIENAAKSESELEADVTKMERRLEESRELSRLQKLAKSLPALEAKHRLAQQAYDDAIAKLKPALDAASTELCALQTECDRSTSCEVYLLGSAMNPEILDEERRLLAARLEIRDKLEPLQNDHAIEAGRLQNLQENLAAAEDGLKRTDPDNAHTYRMLKKEITEVSDKIKLKQPIVEQLEKAIELLMAERRTLDAQQAKLRARKLDP